MMRASLKKIFSVAAAFAGLWLGARYVLPVALPFLVGAALAFAAEPLVGRLSVRIPRSVAAGIGVTVTIVGVIAIGALAGAVVVRELGGLRTVLPDLQKTAQQGISLAQDWLVGVADRAPDGVRPLLQRSVLEFFDDGTVLLQQVTQRLPGMLSTTIGWVGDSVLGVGTGVLAAFLISARLPELRGALRTKMPENWNKKYLPAIKRVRGSLWGWLKAQIKLSAVTWGIVTIGFLLLQIPYGPAWAAVVALVDAVPVLGTGTVLVPWSLVCFLQGQNLRAIGILCTYGAALMTRTVLEPRLVGQHLGLDPLATLVALYVGYRFWGILGLLLTPILAAAAKNMVVTSDS